ncbi:putative hydrolase [Lachancea thermotolerans CBS 6340]|uniref:KLTH0F17446p n=1 Tax=Lachancea thermotolerans (strain ATCC 56472 / CBS 6340 / NRRL Y-8284) TaxID=559295 RepID=C5DJL6_LACTC|nr:KLTH0F17446p [Lachancea thermotolerans CBS 6340]CAR24505.1 KLTH0F17446p [Lachancea thermotolerans CBS 6340]
MGGKHLFVLVHGLWGNYKHMNSIRDVFSETLHGSDDILFFSPRQNGYFKTFDGIEIIGYRTLLEICQYMNRFEKGEITKISFVGYSMGGLISRFIIGKIFTECHELFQNIEPQLFITFATPHLGVHFFLRDNHAGHQRAALKLLSALGTTILGRTGRQLFIQDSLPEKSVLVRLSSGDYLEGLARFKHRICVANVKNDRSVAFYTSFITDCDPFMDTGNRIKYEFEHNLPGENLKMVPRIINMDKLDPDASRPPREGFQVLRWILVLLICCALVFILPLFFVANVLGTCYSYLATINYQRMLHKGEGGVLLRRKLGLRDKIADTLRDTVGVLASDQEESLDADSGEPMVKENISWEDFINKYNCSWGSNSKTKFKALNFDVQRNSIYQNLDKLSWIRIPIYIKSLNAHDGIVARKGLKGTTPYSISGLQFVAQLVDFLISQ